MRGPLGYCDAYGAKADEDCAQLWRRIVFSILISNTDDHLRNHGFLYEPAAGWRLSPAYDLNPVPVDIKPRILTTAIDEADGTASLDLAFEVAPHFGVKPDKAKDIVRATIGLAKGLGLVTTAEGIETSDQLSALRADGCVQGQGYLFGQAVPAQGIPALLGRQLRVVA